MPGFFSIRHSQTQQQAFLPPSCQFTSFYPLFANAAASFFLPLGCSFVHIDPSYKAAVKPARTGMPDSFSILHSQNAATSFSASIIAKPTGNLSAFKMLVLCHLLFAKHKTKTSLLYYPSFAICSILPNTGLPGSHLLTQQQVFLSLGCQFLFSSNFHMIGSSDSLWH